MPPNKGAAGVVLFPPSYVLLALAIIALAAIWVVPGGNSGTLKDGDMRALLTAFLTLLVAVLAILDIVIKGGNGNPGEWILGPWLMILTFYFSDKSNQQTADRTVKATAAANEAAAATVLAVKTDQYTKIESSPADPVYTTQEPNAGGGE